MQIELSASCSTITPEVIAGIEAERNAVNPEQTYESYCYDVSERVTSYLRGKGIDADLVEAGTWRDPSHVYTVLTDGTIIDATLDQFYRGGRGNVTGDWEADTWNDGLPNERPDSPVAVILPDHPFTQHYLSHRADSSSDTFPEGYWVKGREPEWWRCLHTDDFLVDSEVEPC